MFLYRHHFQGALAPLPREFFQTRGAAFVDCLTVLIYTDAWLSNQIVSLSPNRRFGKSRIYLPPFPAVTSPDSKKVPFTAIFKSPADSTRIQNRDLLHPNRVALNARSRQETLFIIILITNNIIG